MTTTTPPLVITTTESKIWGKQIDSICGVVAAEKVLVLISSGKLESEEGSAKAIQDIRAQAEALGADAIVEVKIKYEPISGASAMMVTVSGIAVKLEEPRESDDIPF